MQMLKNILAVFSVIGGAASLILLAIWFNSLPPSPPAPEPAPPDLASMNCIARAKMTALYAAGMVSPEGFCNLEERIRENAATIDRDIAESKKRAEDAERAYQNALRKSCDLDRSVQSLSNIRHAPRPECQ